MPTHTRKLQLIDPLRKNWDAQWQTRASTQFRSEEDSGGRGRVRRFARVNTFAADVTDSALRQSKKPPLRGGN